MEVESGWQGDTREQPRRRGASSLNNDSPGMLFFLSVNATRLGEALERPPWVRRSALGDPGFSLNTVNIE